jgi:hypothetical protein
MVVAYWVDGFWLVIYLVNKLQINIYNTIAVNHASQSDGFLLVTWKTCHLSVPVPEQILLDSTFQNVMLTMHIWMQTCDQMISATFRISNIKMTTMKVETIAYRQVLFQHRLCLTSVLGTDVKQSRWRDHASFETKLLYMPGGTLVYVISWFALFSSTSLIVHGVWERSVCINTRDEIQLELCHET